MSLSSFTPRTEAIQLPGGGNFTVRGLATEDFLVLIRRHYATFDDLFRRYVGEGSLEIAENGAGTADVRGVVLDVIEHAPGFIGDVIARASDEPDSVKQARSLPLGAQIDALERIVMLTLEAEGGVEKLTATVKKLVGMMGGLTGGRPA